MWIRPILRDVHLCVVHLNLTAPYSRDVERNVDCRAVQVCRPATFWVGSPFTPDESQEESLKDVFGVGSIPGDSEGGFVHQLMVFEKCLLDFTRVGAALITLYLCLHTPLTTQTGRD